MEQLKPLKFRIPEVKEIEVYLVRLPDGRIVARTKEELEKEKGGEKSAYVGEKARS